MKYNVVVLVVLCAIFGSAYAYDGWSGSHPVDSVRAYPDGNVLIQMANANNPSGCSDTNYLSLPQDGTEGRKKQYVTLLSAYMANKKVKLALTGCTNGGTSGYPVIEQVWLTK